jgi:hypothetical protein
VAQVVEYLPSNCEALNSNPSTAKKKKKKVRKASMQCIVAYFERIC